MPSVTYNGQSFAIDGRRVWLLGASIHYARVPASLWEARIEAARQAGFNAIETACPWLVHEPRSGRFEFQENADLRRFVEFCGEAGMRVILRVGPYVGAQYDAGGLPGWLVEMPRIRLREADPLFLEHVSRYFRRLLGEINELQVTNGGPILLVQSEHAWTCSNDSQAEHYLHEITRFIRESGITIPITNANDLWQEIPGTIATWRGYDDLLVHLRQLRTVQPDSPRIVSEFHAATTGVWGVNVESQKRKPAEAGSQKGAASVLRRLAEVLASGAQPVVSPFHAGTNFDFLGGRIAGMQAGFTTTSAALDSPLGEAGARGKKYHAIRRLITFANHFSHVFAELDPDYQPIVLDPETFSSPSAEAKSKASEFAGVASVVPLRGSQGRLAFVFGDHNTSGDSVAMLVLDDGIRLPVHLGDQPVGWFALDVDLQGVGRLEYSNICPWALIDRSIIVFQGPPRAPVYISISGTPLEVTVPGNGAKPLVMEHKGLTIVVCNQEQIDAAYHDETSLYVGIEGFDSEGRPLPSAEFPKAWTIRRHAAIDELKFEQRKTDGRGGRAAATSAGAITLNHWRAALATAYITGESPRFASLEGPESLSECGAPSGYGWYRVTVDATGRVLCHAPDAADRLHLFVGGKRQHLFGVGPGAEPGPFELRFSKNEQVFVALVDNAGRFAEGNDLSQRKGIWGHLHEVKPMRAAKAKGQSATPVDPFAQRHFIAGRAAGQLSETWQAVWTIAHSRKTPILVDVNGARASGSFVLNDEPLAYYAGATGGCMARILIDPKSSKAFKRGKNVLRFAPDPRQEDAVQEISRATTIYECVRTLTEGSAWSFAKWEPPAASAYTTLDKTQLRNARGQPCWWRASFQLPAKNGTSESPAYWLDTTGLSKGQAYVNGVNLGRYFTSTAAGRAVGPQTRLFVPTTWLKFGQTNDVELFDEHGAEPDRVRILRGLSGETEE